MKFKSFDEIVKEQEAAKKDDGKVVTDANLKERKRIELNQKVDKAKLEVMDKKAAFEQAVITPGVAIDAAALALQGAETTLEFYEKLHKDLFL